MTLAADHDVIAFCGDRLVARGRLADVLGEIHRSHQHGAEPLTFDLATGKLVDLDLRGDLDAALRRLPPPPSPEKKGPGRPRLGVVPREVTLLPRHWEWLAGQPGGASVALRKLVESAMRQGEGPERVRRCKEATYRFMTAIAGDRPGYEEAVRRLFAGDPAGFDAAIASWPDEIREAARGMAQPAWIRSDGG
jgi:hypothetical protein